MVNPAYMTRQIAEIAERADGVKYHIWLAGALGNAPDQQGGRGAAHLPEHGKQQEMLSLVQLENGPVHRYMAPLLVKQACPGLP